MPLLKNNYTSEDYWNLPEGERAELIGGKFYDMAPPSRIHQRLVSKLTALFNQYITDHHGSCEVYPAPFAVNLDADDKDWVEPDISVICDPNKMTADAPELRTLLLKLSLHPAVEWTITGRILSILMPVSVNIGSWIR